MNILSKLAWVSDLHLSSKTLEDKLEFFASLSMYTGIVVTGNISDSPFLDLDLLQAVTGSTVYFVLDASAFKNKTFEDVEDAAKALQESNPNVVYLSTDEDVKSSTSSSMYFIGSDGCPDVGLGNYEEFQSYKYKSAICGDLLSIEDFKLAKLLKGYEGISKMAQYKSNVSNEHLVSKIDLILNHESKKYSAFKPSIDDIFNIDSSDPELEITTTLNIFASVSPFEEGCKIIGKSAFTQGLPMLCNSSLGRTLMNKAMHNPSIQFNVYCKGFMTSVDTKILPNLRLVASGSRIYKSLEVLEEVSL